MVVIHSTSPAWKSAAMAISIRLTVQLPPTKARTPLASAVLDDAGVDRIEDDDGVVAHAQRGGGVDPVALPAGLAQRRVDLGGVVAALATDQHVAGREVA